jgi:hypothetical protein
MGWEIKKVLEIQKRVLLSSKRLNKRDTHTSRDREIIGEGDHSSGYTIRTVKDRKPRG